ncbi:hypothetical protein SNEBB_008183 [Seison nebaliae]|nr:hypothetical protein SNEBB_008183 [Seison nebaliae]
MVKLAQPSKFYIIGLVFLITTFCLAVVALSTNYWNKEDLSLAKTFLHDGLWYSCKRINWAFGIDDICKANIGKPDAPDYLIASQFFFTISVIVQFISILLAFVGLFCYWYAKRSVFSSLLAWLTFVSVIGMTITVFTMGFGGKGLSINDTDTVIGYSYIIATISLFTGLISVVFFFLDTRVD